MQIWCGSSVGWADRSSKECIWVSAVGYMDKKNTVYSDMINSYLAHSSDLHSTLTVSYTHLDVYKRQLYNRAGKQLSYGRAF